MRRSERAAVAEHRHEPGPAIAQTVAAAAPLVWSVLADGWSYANWVVGAAKVRDVDPDWPEPGTRVHHAFGIWPLLLQDYTWVAQVTPGRDLILTARGWPVGEARVHLSVQADGDDRSVVTITEDAVSGPGTLVPRWLRRLVLVPRNHETLHRLALLAEGRQRAANAPGVRLPNPPGSVPSRPAPAVFAPDPHRSC